MVAGWGYMNSKNRTSVRKPLFEIRFLLDPEDGSAFPVVPGRAGVADHPCSWTGAGGEEGGRSCPKDGMGFYRLIPLGG